jgi:hypothetical protein
LAAQNLQKRNCSSQVRLRTCLDTNDSKYDYHASTFRGSQLTSNVLCKIHT